MSLRDLTQLENLFMMRITKMSDLSVLRELESLKTLRLDWMRNVTSIPSFASLSRLQRVELDTMKGLTDLSPIAAAPALRRLHIGAMHNSMPRASDPSSVTLASRSFSSKPERSRRMRRSNACFQGSRETSELELLRRAQLKPSFCEPLFQHRETVVAPERLIFEDEDRHAEDVISRGFVLRTFVVGGAIAGEIGMIFVG